MSLRQDMAKFDAEEKFWETRELVEKLLLFLDLASIKELAKSHWLTRKILSNVFFWNKLIKKTFPESENFNLGDEETKLPKEDDLHLASERPKAKLLSQILNTIQGSQRLLLEMDLLHTICERYKIDPEARLHFVSVTCFCNQIHDVSPRGFVLLEDIEATMGSQKQGVEEVYIDFFSGELAEPLLTALSSIMIHQLEMVRSFNIGAVGCHTKESAEAFARIMKNSQGEGLEAWR